MSELDIMFVSSISVQLMMLFSMLKDRQLLKSLQEQNRREEQARKEHDGTHTTNV